MNPHEANNSDDLDNREDEFRLSIALDAKEIYGYNQDQEYGDPCGVVDARAPEVHCNGSSNDFQRHGDQPVHRVVPAHGEAPCRIDKASRVRGEGAGHWEDDCQLAEGMDSAVEHHTDQRKGDEQRARATGGERLAGANEEPGPFQVVSAHGLKQV